MLKYDATRILRDVESQASRIILETANDVLSISQQLVPIDTGALKASGRVEQVSPTKVRIIYGNETVTYSRLIEYGSSNSAAQPFLTPAASQAESIIRKKAASAVRSK